MRPLYEPKKIKVAINGYGTIGKRVADAVSRQDDMEVVGVAKVHPDYNAKRASTTYDLYVVDASLIESFKEKEIEVKGTLEELLEKANIVIDCTPAKTGLKNKPLYAEKKLKAIFQGGEVADIGVSFCADCNYEDALGKDYVRVVSCNTTGLCRTLGELYRNFGIEMVEAQLIRRGADLKDCKKGPIGQIIPVIKKGNHGHHAADVKTIMPYLNIHTMAVAVPSMLMHVHCVQATLSNSAKRDDVIGIFNSNPRILLLKSSNGFRSTGDIIEWARDFRKRNDLYEIVVFEDSIAVEGNTVRYYQAVHQEADVIPDNIDAIRAVFNLGRAAESMQKTNASLGIGKLRYWR